MRVRTAFRECRATPVSSAFGSVERLEVKSAVSDVRIAKVITKISLCERLHWARLLYPCRSKSLGGTDRR